MQPRRGAFSICASPVTHTSLTDDTHLFSVRAVNGAGTHDPTPAAWVWLVDTVAPETSLVSAPVGTLAVRDASVSFVSNDADASFECKLKAAEFAACASPAIYGSLADGEYTLEIRAVDTAGNVDASPLVARF